jgi:hypothetical protein
MPPWARGTLACEVSSDAGPFRPGLGRVRPGTRRSSRGASSLTSRCPWAAGNTSRSRGRSCWPTGGPARRLARQARRSRPRADDRAGLDSPERRTSDPAAPSHRRRGPRSPTASCPARSWPSTARRPRPAGSAGGSANRPGRAVPVQEHVPGLALLARGLADGPAVVRPRAADREQLVAVLVRRAGRVRRLDHGPLHPVPAQRLDAQRSENAMTEAPLPHCPATAGVGAEVPA